MGELVGGEGGVEEEESESYLWVVVRGLGVASGGGSTASGGRQRCYAAAAAFRRGVEVMARPGSFVGMRASGFGDWWRAAWARVVAQHGGAGGSHGEQRRCASAGGRNWPATRRATLQPGTAAPPRGAAQGCAEAARDVRWRKPGRPAAMARTRSTREQREEEKMAEGEQQQKEAVAQRQRGTRETRASFGGAVANLALVTPAKYRGVTVTLVQSFFAVYPFTGDAIEKDSRLTSGQNILNPLPPP